MCVLLGPLLSRIVCHVHFLPMGEVPPPPLSLVPGDPLLRRTTHLAITKGGRRWPSTPPPPSLHCSVLRGLSGVMRP